jgi:NADPH:quinone reductase-like Zn-dependent oxidoreductase
MKAAVYHKYGPPEVVQITETEQPVPKDHEVLVKVYASTVNRTDCGFRSMEYFIARFWGGLIRPRNKILGNEFAGVIAKTGKGVNSFQPGDRVFGYNDVKFGAHAEYLIMAENDAIAIIPGKLSYDEAAPILEGAHYALCDIRAAGIGAGQHVLVYGATGAIGSAAVQLIRYFGARVSAVCPPQHMDLVRSLGADEVIDLSSQDFTKLGLTFDVVFDAVGKTSFGVCKPILKSKGIYMSTELGRWSQNPLLAIITPVWGGKKVLFPIPTITKADVQLLKELVEKGHFKPVIDRYYTLDRIVDAYRYVETRQKIGNVVIRVANP